jgi:sigma-B regulation protein RsbU (phosphoserine phosphatase)
MHRGVRDFVQKPWDNSQLLRSLRMQIEAGRKRRQEKRLEAENRTANDHLQQELSESQEIQEALLPKELPAIEGIEVAVTWKPARAVSGDYFDVIKFSDRHTALCVADVAGKGMPAALMMSNMQAVLKSIASDVTAPADLCGRVNSVMCHNIVSHRFISCFYALLDTKTRKLKFSNAGHCPPMLIRDGNCMRLKDGGPVLGIFPDRLYTQDEIELQSGDCIVLYTDGVTEACDAGGQEFGEERLIELLMVGHNLHATELRDRVMTAVNEFSGGHADDDATLMVLTVD